MKKDNGAHVIVSKGYGDYSSYACTVENAQAILNNHLDTLPSEIQEMAEMVDSASAQAAPVLGRIVQEAFEELLNKKPGEAAQKLRRLLYGAVARGEADTRPEVTIVEADQKELVLWLFEKGLSAKPLDGKLLSNLNEFKPENELSFLAPFTARMGKPVHYIEYQDYYEGAKALHTLKANRWKEDAEEHKIVERYLSFVREWLVDTSDITYHVTELSASFN